MNIILLGAAGSGKGTQAKRIAEKYDMTHISMGDLCRAAAKEDTEIGRKIKKILTTGDLVPTEITFELLKKKIKECGNIVFDGFPRSLDQAELLDEICEPNLVISIEIPDEEAIRRLSKRRQCKKCGEITTDEYEKCPKCEGELYHRKDDYPEAIKERLEIYHENVEPLKEYYKPRDIVHIIDGTQTREKVFENICKIIDSA